MSLSVTFLSSHMDFAAAFRTSLNEKNGSQNLYLETWSLGEFCEATLDLIADEGILVELEDRGADGFHWSLGYLGEKRHLTGSSYDFGTAVNEVADMTLSLTQLMAARRAA